MKLQHRVVKGIRELRQHSSKTSPENTQEDTRFIHYFILSSEHLSFTGDDGQDKKYADD